jgi:hypothetical protein
MVEKVVFENESYRVMIVLSSRVIIGRESIVNF